ncbi:8-oxo-dGTP diphosphatase [Balamuthia mandrillaris]
MEKKKTQGVIPCAGVVIFAGGEERGEGSFGASLKVALVKTKEGRWGFPKGKRNRGETSLQTAFREVKEETGLDAGEDYELLPQQEDLLLELSVKGNPAVEYFVAKALPGVPANKPLVCLDQDEQLEVEWVDVEEALRRVSREKNRRSILEAAKKKLLSS